LADRKKMLKAAAIAAVVIVPIVAAAWYFWPKDVLIYVFAEKDPYSFEVTVNGDMAIRGAWEGNGNPDISTQLVRFAKKTIAGTGFEIGVLVNGSEPLKKDYSVLQGSYVSVYLYKEAVILQTNVEPQNYGRPIH
jgi:hypothetical protein